jgi:hypothetical protein
MPSFPPLVVNVNAKNWSCVLDIHLVLSRYGLLFALRLAEEMNVWLVRTLWDILDNTQYHLLNPETLAMHARDEGNDSLVAALNQWQTARTETDLLGNHVFWTGDSIQDSLLPKEVDKNLISRFELLAKSIDSALEHNNLGPQPSQIFLDCSRDAVALSAALAKYRPIVFTVHGGRGEGAGHETEPYLCRFLRSCGVPCRRAKWDGSIKLMQDYLAPIFVRTGIAELVWAGMSLAAVHIVAPRAYVVPSAADEESFHQGLPPLSDDDAESEQWWDDAVAFWYPIG